MPRVSKKEMENNRTHIEDNSSRLIREKGFQVSVAELMGASNLTHGGFYKHFQSKEELMGIACQKAFEESVKKWNKRVEDASNLDNARKSLIEGYLSRDNKNEPGNGCPISSLAIDVSREPLDAYVRVVFQDGIEKLLNILKETHPNLIAESAGDSAINDLSCMVGALILARATDGELSEKFLTIAKAHLLDEL
ncbi:TetR/AcrR family transcriptional regulator [Acinetobacter baumannii]|uniref:TetR/AcrR family transcriptional regulator n=1 Tax=Acinetobacter baumannii TaxID=470 RepID=UPI000BF3B0F2|nr:TetR/AcrR family transcriptional regulator [Acinetobacter baumannii]